MATALLGVMAGGSLIGLGFLVRFARTQLSQTAALAFGEQQAD